MLKFEKKTLQVATYKNFKNYNKELLEKDIQIKLSEFDFESIPHETFSNNFIDSLNLYAPLKKKYLRANHSKFISTKKQRNICVRLLRMVKRNYYNDHDLSNVTDNRKFWKTIR